MGKNSKLNIQPLVTVYITNHNYGSFLKRAIQSVLNQTLKNFELIIIDDGSTDNSKKIINSYRKNYKIIKIFQKNRGLTVSNNLALRLSKGKYIMRLDADDWLDNNALEVMSNTLERRPDVGLVFPDYFEVDRTGKMINLVRRHNFKKVKLYDQPAHGACTLIRKECLEKIGGYSEKYDRQDGYYLWIKFIQRYKVLNINLPLFFYRKHGNSLSNNEEKILSTRSNIIQSNLSKKSLKKRALAILPIRGLKINPGSYVLKKLKGKPLVLWIIDSLIKAKNISKIVITSPDENILSYLKKKYKSKILTHKRDEKLGGINIELDQTLKLASIFAKKNRIKFDYIFQLSYKTPFIKSTDIDGFINLIDFFKTDQVLAVRTEFEPIYKHDGNGLKSINVNSNLKLERDQVYKGIDGIRVFRKKFVSKNKKIYKTGHYILDQKSAHVINNELEWKIASTI